MVQTVTDNHTAVSDVIAWELEGNHRPSRKNVTIAASQSLVNGQVVAFDGSGNVIKFSVQATNAAAGIFIGDAVTTGAFLNGVCRHELEVNIDNNPFAFLNGVCRHEH